MRWLAIKRPRKDVASLMHCGLYVGYVIRHRGEDPWRAGLSYEDPIGDFLHRWQGKRAVERAATGKCVATDDAKYLRRRGYER